MKLFFPIFISVLITGLLLSSCNQAQNTETTEIRRKIDTVGKYYRNIIDKDFTDGKKTANWIYEESKKINYLKGEAIGLTCFAILMHQVGKYDSAISYSLEALEIRLKIHDSFGIVNSYINLANNYNKLKSRNQQRKYLNLALDFLQSYNDLKSRSHVYNELAIFYSSINQNDSAKLLFSKSLKLSTRIDDSSVKAMAAENYGNILNQMEDIDSALYYYNIALPIYRANKSIIQLARIYNNIAMIYWNSDERDSVKLYLEKGYHETEKLGTTSDKEKYLTNMINFWEEAPDLQKSNLFLHELVDFKDSIFNKNLASKIASIEKNFEVKLQKEENEKLKSQISRKNIIRNAAIVFSVLVLILAIYQVRLQRQKRNLAEQDKTIKDNEIDQLLKERELKNLDALLEGRETERKRIGRDLHDRLGSILSTVKLHFSAIEDRFEGLKKENQTQYQKAAELLDEAVGEVRKIAQDLASGVLAKYGLGAALADIKNTLESTGKIKINIFETGTDQRLDTELEIGIYRIIQELMSNILKHAEASKADIHFTKDAELLTLIVEDNGKGFDPEKPEKFGMGMANLRQRVAQLGGEISFDSKPGSGATVIIEIPHHTEDSN